MGLGNYRLVQQFSRSDDMEQAKKLLERVAGKTVSLTMERERQEDDYLPITQGEGAHKRVSINLLDSFSMVEDSNINEARSNNDNLVIEREDFIPGHAALDDMFGELNNSDEVAPKEGGVTEISGKVAPKDSEVTENEAIEVVDKTLRPRIQAVVYQEDEYVDEEQLLLNEILGTEEEDEFVPAPEDEEEEEFEMELITRKEVEGLSNKENLEENVVLDQSAKKSKKAEVTTGPSDTIRPSNVFNVDEGEDDSVVVTLEENDEADIVTLENTKEAVIEGEGASIVEHVVSDQRTEKSKEAEVTNGPSANIKHSDVFNVDEGEDAIIVDEADVVEADIVTLEENDEGVGAVEVTHDEDAIDSYPNMERHGDIFLIPGIGRDIVVKPREDKCSLCKPKNRSNWCRHLVAAGKKLSIFLTPAKDGTKGLHFCYEIHEGQEL